MCDSKICQEIEEKFISSINTSIEPCDDFYSYVCSRFMESNSVPINYTSTEYLLERVRNQLKDIIQHMKTNTSTTTLHKKVLNLYKGCKNTERREKIGVQPLKNLLNEIGGWPLLGSKIDNQYDWEKVYALSTREYAMNMIIEIAVIVDTKNTTRHIIQVSDEKNS
ncbi:neprilysin-1-like [Centruroides vittatus]|uniref:neprilysin-1-like n=1 Tax=Centruroides vittatus TaxID=120091 RepID=UPI00350FF089